MYATLVSIKNIVQWKQHTFIPFSFFTPSFSASEQNFVPWDIFPALETHLALTLFLTFLHKKALLQCTSSYLTGDRQVKSYCHVTMMQKEWLCILSCDVDCQFSTTIYYPWLRQSAKSTQMTGEFHCVLVSVHANNFTIRKFQNNVIYMFQGASLRGIRTLPCTTDSRLQWLGLSFLHVGCLFNICITVTYCSILIDFLTFMSHKKWLHLGDRLTFWGAKEPN